MFIFLFSFKVISENEPTSTVVVHNQTVVNDGAVQNQTVVVQHHQPSSTGIPEDDRITVLGCNFKRSYIQSVGGILTLILTVSTTLGLFIGL